MYKWQNQPKKRVTIKMIKGAEPNSVMVYGSAYIEHPWFNDAKINLEDDGRSTEVNFVIYRGTIEDWCIYHSLNSNLERTNYLEGKSHLSVPFETVMKFGAKLYREEIIRAVVQCTDEVFTYYRF